MRNSNAWSSLGLRLCTAWMAASAEVTSQQAYMQAAWTQCLERRSALSVRSAAVACTEGTMLRACCLAGSKWLAWSIKVLQYGTEQAAFRAALPAACSSAQDMQEQLLTAGLVMSSTELCASLKPCSHMH